MGKRALFSVPGDNANPGIGDPSSRDPGAGDPAVVADSEQSPATRGRHAFFSPTPEQPPDMADPRRPGALAVECQSCHQQTTVGLLGMMFALTPSIWLPFGRFNRWMRCPACHRMAWCRTDWGGLFGVAVRGR